MKVNEIVTESSKSRTVKKVSKNAKNSLPKTSVQRSLRNSDAYSQYRYGMAVASARAVANGDVSFSDETAMADSLTQVMYSEEDTETIKLASKLFGVTPTSLTNTKSHENPSVNKSSPVAKKKKNKYGV